MNPLHIKPNVPQFVALVDPEGQYDFDRECGIFQTTAGETVELPRIAVIKLNELAPQPGEEIVIQQHWSGRPSDKKTWTVALSTRSELARAEQEMTQDLAPQLEASIRQAEERKPLPAYPTPIAAPLKRGPKPETAQPRLFDRGTGTNGPVPAPVILPAAAISKRPGPIPWDIAFREVSAWVAKEARLTACSRLGKFSVVPPPERILETCI